MKQKSFRMLRDDKFRESKILWYGKHERFFVIFFYAQTTLLTLVTDGGYGPDCVFPTFLCGDLAPNMISRQDHYGSNSG